MEKSFALQVQIASSKLNLTTKNDEFLSFMVVCLVFICIFARDMTSLASHLFSAPGGSSIFIENPTYVILEETSYC